MPIKTSLRCTPRTSHLSMSVFLYDSLPESLFPRSFDLFKLYVHMYLNQESFVISSDAIL